MEVLGLGQSKEEGEEGGGGGAGGGTVREVVFIENENGVQVQFPQDLSQTETVGRAYAWRTVGIVAKTDESGSEEERKAGATT